MERKTLLYQPSGQADKRAYTQVNAPAGAFGDAGGAMAGFGRDVQSLGGSVAQVGRNLELKDELAKRKDQDNARQGLAAIEAAHVKADDDLQTSINAASGDGYKAQQEGRSAQYIKTQANKHLDQWKSENPKWAPPEREEHRKDFELQSETMATRFVLSKKDDDIKRNVTLRTDFENNSTKESYARLSSNGYLGAIEAYNGNVSRLKEASGINRPLAERSNQENLMAAMEKNPLPFDVPDEERKKIHDWAIDAGMTGHFAASYVKKDEPKLTVAQFKDNFSEIVSKGITDPNALGFLQEQADFLKRKGELTEQQANTVVARAGMEIDIRSGSQSPAGLNKDRHDAVMLNATTQDPEVIRKMFGEAAKDFDVEDLKRLRDLAVASAKEFKNSVDNHPEFFAEKRTLEAGALSRDILNTVDQHLRSNDEGPAPIQGMLDKYSTLVAGSLKSAGYPAEPGRRFVPPDFLKNLSASSSIGSLNTATSSFDPATLRSLSASAVSQDSKIGAVLTLTSALPATVYRPGQEQGSPGSETRSSRFEAIKTNLLHLANVHDNKVKGFEEAYLKQPDRKDAPNGRDVAGDIDNLYKSMPASGTGFNLASFINGVPVQETTEVTLQDTVAGIAKGLGLSSGDTVKLHNQFKDLILRDAASRDMGSPANRVHEATSAMAKSLKDMGLLTYTDDKGNSSTMYLPLEGETNWFQDLMFSRGANQAENINFAEKSYGYAVEGMNRHFSKMLLAERLDGGVPYRKFWYNSVSTKNLGWVGKQDTGPGIVDETVFDWALDGQLEGMDKTHVRALGHLSNASFVRSPDHGGFVVVVPPGTKSTFFNLIPLSGSSQVVVRKDTGKPFMATDAKMAAITQHLMQYDSEDTSRMAEELRTGLYSGDGAQNWGGANTRSGRAVDGADDRDLVFERLNTIATQQSRFLSP